MLDKKEEKRKAENYWASCFKHLVDDEENNHSL